jgi:hypothetical protein
VALKLAIETKLQGKLMSTHFAHAIGLVAIIAVAGPAQATTEASVELAFMPRTMTVTLLNDGGKYVAIDLKHIDQGGTCRMDKDATLVRVGSGEPAGTVRVRYAAPQLSSGGCPFLTEFNLSDADYAAARKAFEDAKEEAEKKIQRIKEEIGEKWDEVTGKTK